MKLAIIVDPIGKLQVDVEGIPILQLMVNCVDRRQSFSGFFRAFVVEPHVAVNLAKVVADKRASMAIPFVILRCCRCRRRCRRRRC